MPQEQQTCGNCRFFCQAVDRDMRQYFDDRSGECRRSPPRDHFIWSRTRIQHWCGDWESRTRQTVKWKRISEHPKDDRPVLLYKKGAFEKQCGIIVGYWNKAFNRWHDGRDNLFDPEEFSHWSPLPEEPI